MKGKKFKYFKPSEFFYITHIDNLQSILDKGILCHNKTEKEGYIIKEISNEEIMDRRKEKGLKFLKENYKEWRIESLALPALGCGLGKLSWEEVGPLMVKYLKDLGINVGIYLPNYDIPEDQKTKEFLLSLK